MTSTPPVWLITGSSAGLGLALTRYVLNQGHKVIATSRNPSRVPDLVEEVESRGSKWIALDLTGSDLEDQVKRVETVFGRIDVVVNCAGFALMGAIEDTPMSKVYAQMDTNFYGPLRIIKTLLPTMRTRKSGTIINVSSSQTFLPSASVSMYGASKAALDAYTESLEQEVKPFGIKVLLVHPGAFRTEFATGGSDRIPLSKDYAKEDHPIVQRMIWMDTLPKAAKGDPQLAAKVMFEAATGDFDQLHLLISESAWTAATKHAQNVSHMLETQKELAASADSDVPA